MQDLSFEKMGSLMADNAERLLAMFDELSAFLTKVNLYKGKNLSDSHDLAVFLELYNSNLPAASVNTSNPIVTKLVIVHITAGLMNAVMLRD